MEQNRKQCAWYIKDTFKTFILAVCIDLIMPVYTVYVCVCYVYV